MQKIIINNLVQILTNSQQQNLSFNSKQQNPYLNLVQQQESLNLLFLNQQRGYSGVRIQITINRDVYGIIKDINIWSLHFVSKSTVRYAQEPIYLHVSVQVQYDTKSNKKNVQVTYNTLCMLQIMNLLDQIKFLLQVSSIKILKVTKKIGIIQFMKRNTITFPYLLKIFKGIIQVKLRVIILLEDPRTQGKEFICIGINVGYDIIRDVYYRQLIIIFIYEVSYEEEGGFDIGKIFIFLKYCQV
ncbi:hypothetical protein ABPG73_002194 [Tetrahymena malaccensis]